MDTRDSTSWIASFIKDISTCFVALTQIQDLSPSPQVNALFGQLVSLCLQAPGETIVSQVALLQPPALNGIVPADRILLDTQGLNDRQDSSTTSADLR